METQSEEQINPLQEFIRKEVLPLIEEEDRYRQKFKNRFWFYSGLLLFINCINTLIVLFQYLIYNRPVSGSQLFLIALVSVFILLWYAQKAQKKKLPDVLAKFIRFYGNWTVSYSKEVTTFSDELIPHSGRKIEKTAIRGDDNTSLVMKQFVFLKRLYKNMFTKNGGGIWLDIKLAQKAPGKLILFEKGGFYKKKKYEGLELVSSNIGISNHFYSFTDSRQLSEYVVRVVLFENILDLKEVFKASKIYVRIENDRLNVFLQNGRFLYNNSSLWHFSGGEKKLMLLHEQIEKIFTAVKVIETLIETAVVDV
ncbi:MAG: DUF3137 domain-containing protein [Pseudomonadota bacterium]|nr:DUF3137 domain-containing protein [Pseudomonadota bacterium]